MKKKEDIFNEINFEENKEESVDDGKLSFRERSVRDHKRKRRKQLLIILGNIALALVIVMVVLSVKAKIMPQSDNHKNNKKQVAEKVKATATPEPTPAATKEPEGKEKWIRKDLDPSRPMIAFTFDDGPYTKVDKRILKVMKENNGRCTFFVVGSRVARYADDLKQIYADGHQIGSHTFSHQDLSKLKGNQIKEELDKTNRVVKSVIGCETTSLRPPYGNVNDAMRKNVKVPMYYWCVDSEDWKSRNKIKIWERCRKSKDGDIILMHDLYDSTAAAIEQIVPYWSKAGVQLVTLDELFYYKKLNAEPGKVYYSGR